MLRVLGFFSMVSAGRCGFSELLEKQLWILAMLDCFGIYFWVFRAVWDRIRLQESALRGLWARFQVRNEKFCGKISHLKYPILLVHLHSVRKSSSRSYFWTCAKNSGRNMSNRSVERPRTIENEWNPEKIRFFNGRKPPRLRTVKQPENPENPELREKNTVLLLHVSISVARLSDVLWPFSIR